MAYLEFAPAGGAQTDRTASDRAAFVPKGFAAWNAGLSDLEWTVVDLAQHDHIASVERPGAVARFMRWIVGIPAKTPLSSPRLEALRRMAVLSWYRGFAVEPAEVRAFVAAGFTLDQYEMLLARISARRAALPRRFQR